ncbi:methyltransferase [Aurantimonas sp. E1-2-R+4]|uniref:tRNA1(Val) (adenine(37)-N6)-methyltransferase n=1 Tax=Aurantimonas sp. E1-2-R+4 TaxID=3113714 RepID=UPI002F91D224
MNCPDRASTADDTDPSQVRRDAFYRGRFVVLQPACGGYRSGLDAMLLAATLPESATGSVADIGAGAGVVGLAAACRAERVEVTLVEKSAAMADLARRGLTLPENVAHQNRVRVVAADILAGRAGREAAGLCDGAFQHVLTNPPFYPHGHRASPDPLRAEALTATDADFLPRWVRACAALLGHGGRFTAIVRPDALPAMLQASEGRLGGIRVLPIHSRSAAPAIRLMVAGRKGSRAPLAVLPGRTLHAPDGGLEPFAEAIAAGTADIALDC